MRGEEGWSALSTRPVGQAGFCLGHAWPVMPCRAGETFMTNASERGKESPSVLDPETLELLLRQLESTDVDELEVVQGDARILLRREPGRRTARVLDHPVPRLDQDSDVVIVAPLTGIFYGRPSPEQAAFVEQGQSVEPGQVVALIETMKLFNEVTVELHGEVTRIAATDGDLVESGQPLVYIRPAEPDDVE